MKTFWHGFVLSLLAILLVGSNLPAAAIQKTPTTENALKPLGAFLPPGNKLDLPAVSGDEYWDNRFNTLGVSGYVNAIAVSGENVYVGGQFSAVGSLPVNNIARWNSTTGAWSALGSGVSGPVYAIAVGADGLYVGGSFSQAGSVTAANVARWNGTSWSALVSGQSDGVSGSVFALTASGNDVFVGGQFYGISGVSSVYVQNIGRWNTVTRTWGAMGFGTSGPVFALAASGNDVYVGGLFTTAGETANTQNIAKWNKASSAWSALGNGVSNTVRAIAAGSDGIYVGGEFAQIGAVANTQFAARWNGTAWSALGSGVSGHVRSIAVSGSDVYMGGNFSTAGGTPYTLRIAKWGGGSWSALGGGVSGPVHAIDVGTDGIYTGGLFAQTGDKPAQNFGLWHGNVALPADPDDIYWDSRFGGQPGESSPNGRVCAIAVSGEDVYIGGDFTMAGGIAANNIVKWNSRNNLWSALGSGVTNPGVGCAVRGIAVSGSNIYVGGVFGTAGGVPGTQSIARWDGSAWHSLGGGTAGGGVDAVASEDGVVYIAGLFSSVRKVYPAIYPSDFLLVHSIAGWNENAQQQGWFALNGSSNVGLNSRTSAVKVVGGNVYAGGDFDQAGGAPMNYIARWDGTTWSPLGDGMSTNWVHAIAVSGARVYAGGTFTSAGGVPVNYIARWDGANWSALGSGVGSPFGTFYPVTGLAALGEDVYAVGTFRTAGGATANRIARWNNTTQTWSPLGSGLGGDGIAVAIGNESIYVGGQFYTAGDKPSRNFAVWHTSLPHLGSISGQVTSDNGAVANAQVQACRIGGGGCYWRGRSDAQGNYRATGLPDGRYRVRAFPPAGSQLMPGSIGPLTITNGAALFGQNIHLETGTNIPSGTTISPVEGWISGVPSVHWKKTLRLVTHGCPGGRASYQILQDEVVVRSGTMTETPPPPGRYEGTIPPLVPLVGYATVEILINCPDGSSQTVTFGIYIDPSGTVRTVHGLPVEGATVTLFYFDEATGEFATAPDGDAMMSPNNRTNPDLTDEEGYFGWDVIAGFYKVRAEKLGCTAPFDPEKTYVESEILVIPPPVTDLDLRLDCDENEIYLPVILK